MYEGDPATVDGGGEASEITDDASAEEDDQGGGASVGEVFEESCAGAGEFVPVFAFLGRWYFVAYDTREACGDEGGLEGIEVEGADLGVCKDEGVGLSEAVLAEGVAERGKAVGADEDGVRSGA